MIDWQAFPWEALATLVTGLAAVVGAVIVGLRQAAITSRQVNIAEAANLASLFDRRMAVYQAAVEYTSSVSVHGLDPYGLDTEIRKRFPEMLSASRFLFRPKVFDALDEIKTKAQDYLSQLHNEARADVEGQTVHLIADDEGSSVLFWWLLYRDDTLHEVFEEDLRLR